MFAYNCTYCKSRVEVEHEGLVITIENYHSGDDLPACPGCKAIYGDHDGSVKEPDERDDADRQTAFEQTMVPLTGDVDFDDTLVKAERRYDNEQEIDA